MKIKNELAHQKVEMERKRFEARQNLKEIEHEKKKEELKILGEHPEQTTLI